VRLAGDLHQLPVSKRRTCDSPLLSKIHVATRCDNAVRGSRLDLYKHERLPIVCDYIDLAKEPSPFDAATHRYSHVRRNYSVAGDSLQIFFCRAFSDSPQIRRLTKIASNAFEDSSQKAYHENRMHDRHSILRVYAGRRGIPGGALILSVEAVLVNN